MNDAPPLLTAEEYVERHAGDYLELVRGRVVQLAPGGVLKGVINGNVVMNFGRFIDAYDDGLVCSNDTFVLTERNPDTVRGGDLVYWSRRRHPTAFAPDGLLELPPDMVVEVCGPRECPAAISQKVEEYVAAGVGVAVVVDTRSESITCHRRGSPPERFTNGEVLVVPDVLPGFAVPVAKFFE